MKKILITLLAAAALGAQAQEVFTSKYNEQCSHVNVRIHDLEYKNPQNVSFEFCPGWETPLEQNMCVHMDVAGSHIRCYRTEYLKEEYLVGKMTRVCFFKRIRRDIEILCSDPKPYAKTRAMPTFSGEARRSKYYGATTFQGAQ